MDDATIQEVVDINSALASNIDRSGPLPYHESSGKILPGCNTRLLDEVRKIKRISDDREMVLNAKKTCIFIANFAKSHQFKPMFGIPGTTRPIKVVLETKLLGYWLTSDLKPTMHVEFIVGKAMKRIWIIRRLKSVGASDRDLAAIFTVLIRPILETCCPVFHPQLTDQDRHDIERVQKIACKVILGMRYVGYDLSLIHI